MDNKQQEKSQKPFRVKTRDLGLINPEFEGLTPNQILAKLDEEKDIRRFGVDSIASSNPLPS